MVRSQASRSPRCRCSLPCMASRRPRSIWWRLPSACSRARFSCSRSSASVVSPQRIIRQMRSLLTSASLARQPWRRACSTASMRICWACAVSPALMARRASVEWQRKDTCRSLSPRWASADWQCSRALSQLPSRPWIVPCSACHAASARRFRSAVGCGRKWPRRVRATWASLRREAISRAQAFSATSRGVPSSKRMGRRLRQSRKAIRCCPPSSQLGLRRDM
ncbi:hypothetical protein D3C81_1043600 [compost metagenome]